MMKPPYDQQHAESTEAVFICLVMAFIVCILVVVIAALPAHSADAFSEATDTPQLRGIKQAQSNGDMVPVASPDLISQGAKKSITAADRHGQGDDHAEAGGSPVMTGPDFQNAAEEKGTDGPQNQEKANTGVGRVTSPTPDSLTWQRYWSGHPWQAKTTKPIRWSWYHLGGAFAWRWTGQPAFQTACAVGEASRQSGFTSFLNLAGAGANIGTTAIVGAKKL